MHICVHTHTHTYMRMYTVKCAYLCLYKCPLLMTSIHSFRMLRLLNKSYSSTCKLYMHDACPINCSHWKWEFSWQMFNTREAIGVFTHNVCVALSVFRENVISGISFLFFMKWSLFFGLNCFSTYCSWQERGEGRFRNGTCFFFLICIFCVCVFNGSCFIMTVLASCFFRLSCFCFRHLIYVLINSIFLS